ncbi:MAG TPA: MnhB domain-containing protein [Chthoniobacteraceae bacterium]|nr:MnhB domain-containing protein [Chthoniobacteraceae bacterium]
MSSHAPVSFFFKTVVRFLFFFINMFAIYLLLRGHNYPGGGFIAGVATAISLILLGLVIGLREMYDVLRVDPVRIAGFGLSVALLTGVAPLLFARPFLEQFTVHYPHFPLIGDLHLGTPLLFDIGVYFVVVGTTCKIIFVLGQSSQQLRMLIEEEKTLYSLPMEEPIEEELLRDDERWGRGVAPADPENPENPT